MYLIREKRQTGKTTNLIKKSAMDGGHIVCTSHREAQQIRQKSIEMKLDIPHPMTYDDLIRGVHKLTGIKILHLDDLDLFLTHLARGSEIKTITWTVE